MGDNMGILGFDLNFDIKTPSEVKNTMVNKINNNTDNLKNISGSIENYLNNKKEDLKEKSEYVNLSVNIVKDYVLESAKSEWQDFKSIAGEFIKEQAPKVGADVVNAFGAAAEAVVELGEELVDVATYVGGAVVSVGTLIADGVNKITNNSDTSYTKDLWKNIMETISKTNYSDKITDNLYETSLFDWANENAHNIMHRADSDDEKSGWLYSLTKEGVKYGIEIFSGSAIAGAFTAAGSTVVNLGAKITAGIIALEETGKAFGKESDKIREKLENDFSKITAQDIGASVFISGIKGIVSGAIYGLASIAKAAASSKSLGTLWNILIKSTKPTLSESSGLVTNIISKGEHGVENWNEWWKDIAISTAGVVLGELAALGTSSWWKNNFTFSSNNSASVSNLTTNSNQKELLDTVDDIMSEYGNDGTNTINKFLDSIVSQVKESVFSDKGSINKGIYKTFEKEMKKLISDVLKSDVVGDFISIIFA